MKALFITTEPNDVTNVIEAWNCWNDPPAVRVTFDFFKPINGNRLIRKAKNYSPNVIFYIGACGAPNCFSPDTITLKKIRSIAPFIHICFDAVVVEWHKLLTLYDHNDCFDLQVSIDGCSAKLVDLVTLAPVVTSFYKGENPKRDIICGLSGNMGCGPRWYLLEPLIKEGLVKFRERDVTGEGYIEHVTFIRRCEMLINTSFSGSENFHHVKQRVSEAAFAGCALLENEAAPTKNWYPKELLYTYKGLSDVRDILSNLDLLEAREKGEALRTYANIHYTPQQIYGEMLDKSRRFE